MAIVRGNTQQTNNASASTITVTKPTGISNDHILIFTSSSLDTITSGPSGFSTVVTQLSGGSSTIFVNMWYRIVTGAEGADFSITQGTPDRIYGQCTAFSGIDTGTPFDVTAATNVGSTGTSIAVGGITTATDGAMLLSCFGSDFSTGTVTKPATMSLIANHTSGVGKSHGFADETFTTHGATGTRTWSHSSTSGLSMCAVLAALRPGGAQNYTQTPTDAAVPTDPYLATLYKRARYSASIVIG